jgi:hypothetical protein
VWIPFGIFPKEALISKRRLAESEQRKLARGICCLGQ